VGEWRLWRLIARERLESETAAVAAANSTAMIIQVIGWVSSNPGRPAWRGTNRKRARPAVQ